jgi:hypothetical protein
MKKIADNNQIGYLDLNLTNNIIQTPIHTENPLQQM